MKSEGTRLGYISRWQQVSLILIGLGAVSAIGASAHRFQNVVISGSETVGGALVVTGTATVGGVVRFTNTSPASSSSSSGALQVLGGMSVAKGGYFGDNSKVTGTSATPIQFVGSAGGNGGYLYADADTKGIKSDSGSFQASTAFVGVDTASSGQVRAYTSNNERLNISSTGVVSMLANITSTTTTTGTLKVTGGVGISENLNVGGTAKFPTPFTLGSTSVTSTGTQLNYLASATGTTGTSSTNVVFSTSPTITTPRLIGVTSGNPSAGDVGEVQKCEQDTPQSISTGTQTDLVSCTPTAGDYWVTGRICFSGTLTGTRTTASINTTSANVGSSSNDARIDSPTVPTAAADYCLSIPGHRRLLNGSTAVYLVGIATYTVGTGTFYGEMAFLRIR